MKLIAVISLVFFPLLLCAQITQTIRGKVMDKESQYPLDARALVQNRIGSAVKAREELGFDYKYDLRTGLSKLIEWRDTGKF